jgi:hypothetical protein
MISSEDRQIDHLMRLPWTIVRETTPEGDQLLRVAEIPSAVGSGHTAEAIEADLWQSLRESLRAYLHFNDPVPLPKGAKGPWLQRPAKQPVPYVIRVPQVAATAAASAWTPPHH